jgi:hypothetical protein
MNPDPARRRSPLLIAFVAALAVAACGASTPGGATDRPTQPGSTASPGTADRTPRPTRVPDVIEQFHAAPELEGRLPSSLGGTPLLRESVTGPTFGSAGRRHRLGLRCHRYVGRGMRCRKQKELMEALGRANLATARVEIALAYDDAQRPRAEIQATRVVGADGTAVLAAHVAVERDRAARLKRTLEVRTEDVGGKQVTVLQSQGGQPAQRVRYVYAAGDVLYEIRLASRRDAEVVLGALA